MKKEKAQTEDWASDEAGNSMSLVVADLGSILSLELVGSMTFT